MTREVLLKQWKRKSLVFIGKSEIARQNYAEAIKKLEEAKSILGSDPQYEAYIKQITDLLASAKNNKMIEDKRAKERQAKAFEKSKVTPDEGTWYMYASSDIFISD